MREIKFRGKREDNGEWVVGDLIHRKIWKSKIFAIRIYDDGFDSYEEHEVMPETVGQYTGLKDKNGKEIYEGYIVVITYERWRKYTVEYWGKDFGSYVLVKDGKYFESCLADHEDIEVIGNIHEQEGE